MSIRKCQQKLDCNKASVVESFYEYQCYSFCSWNPGISSVLFMHMHTHTYYIYIIYIEGTRRRNLGYFPLQCAGVQRAQQSHDLLACEVLALLISEQDCL